MRLIHVFYFAILIGSNLTCQAYGDDKALSTIPRKIMQSYKECRLDIIHKLQARTIDKTAAKNLLEGCKDLHAGVSNYLDCKKKVLAQFSRGPKDSFKEELQKCHNLLASISFDNESPMPFQRLSDKIYFAGLGLNITVSLMGKELPNFDCSHAKNAMENFTAGDFFMFGNQPDIFSDLSNSDFVQALKKGAQSFIKENKKTFLVEPLGQVAQIGKNRLSLYFPMGGCTITQPQGEIYSALTIYYLLDRQKKLFIPYFASAFYTPDYKGRTVAQLVDQLERVLSQEGSLYSAQEKKKGTHFVSTAEFLEFDEEGDPFNICKKPWQHEYIGVIKARKNAAAFPEYILVANVNNLCSFGEEAVESFLQRTKHPKSK